MDVELEKDLLFVVSGLGAWETLEDDDEQVFRKGAECIESLQDLLRFLRRDNSVERIILLTLGRWNVVGKQLVPLLTSYRDEFDVVFSVAKVLVQLTMPPRRDAGPVLPEYLAAMRAYKQDFLQRDVLAVLLTVLAEPLSRSEDDRSEDDIVFIELILTLLRNLLAVRDPPGERSNLHDQFVQRCISDHIMEMVLLLTQSFQDSTSQPWAFLLLDLWYAVFSGRDPDMLFPINTATAVSEAEELEARRQRLLGKQAPAPSPAAAAKAAGIASLRQAVANSRASVLTKRTTPGRHSRFGGTFATQLAGGTRSIISKAVDKVVAKPLAAARRSAFTFRRPAQEEAMLPFSSLQIRAQYHELAAQFLDLGCYHALMSVIRDELMTTSMHTSTRLERSDYTAFFGLTAFFTHFHRLRCHRDPSLDIAPLAHASLDLPAFRLVFKSLCSLSGEDGLMKDWIKDGSGGREVCAAAAALREMLLVLQDMVKQCEGHEDPSDTPLGRTTTTLLGNVFYELEYLTVMPRLLREYKAANLPRSFVTTVVTIISTLCSLMDAYKGLLQQRIITHRRRRRAVRKQGETIPGSSAAPDATTVTASDTPASSNFVPSVAAAASDTPAASDTTAASDTAAPSDNADAATHAASSVDPAAPADSADSSTQPAATSEDAAMSNEDAEALRKVQQEMGVPPLETMDVEEKALAADNVEQAAIAALEDEDEAALQDVEGEIDSSDYLASTANCKVVTTIASVLVAYDQLPVPALQALLDLLRRLVTAHMPMLFHIDILVVAEQFLHDDRTQPGPARAMLSEDRRSTYTLLRSDVFVPIVTQFVALAVSNPAAFLEPVVPMHPGTARLLAAGYDHEASAAQGRDAGRWTTAEDMALREHYEELRNDPDRDTKLAARLPKRGPSKTPERVRLRLIKLGLMRKPNSWTAAEDDMLRTQFPQMRSEADACEQLARMLGHGKTRKIVQRRLLALNLMTRREARAVRWTSEEDRTLQQLFATHNGDVAAVAAAIDGGGKSATSVRRRLVYLGLIASRGRVVWTDEEEQRLRALFEEHGRRPGAIADALGIADKPEGEVLRRMWRLKLVPRSFGAAGSKKRAAKKRRERLDGFVTSDSDSGGFDSDASDSDEDDGIDGMLSSDSADGSDAGSQARREELAGASARRAAILARRRRLAADSSDDEAIPDAGDDADLATRMARKRAQLEAMMGGRRESRSERRARLSKKRAEFLALQGSDSESDGAARGEEARSPRKQKKKQTRKRSAASSASQGSTKRRRTQSQSQAQSQIPPDTVPSDLESDHGAVAAARQRSTSDLCLGIDAGAIAWAASVLRSAVAVAKAAPDASVPATPSAKTSLSPASQSQFIWLDDYDFRVLVLERLPFSADRVFPAVAAGTTEQELLAALDSIGADHAEPPPEVAPIDHQPSELQMPYGADADDDDNDEDEDEDEDGDEGDSATVDSDASDADSDITSVAVDSENSDNDRESDSDGSDDGDNGGDDDDEEEEEEQEQDQEELQRTLAGQRKDGAEADGVRKRGRAAWSQDSSDSSDSDAASPMERARPKRRRLVIAGDDDDDNDDDL